MSLYHYQLGIPFNLSLPSRLNVTYSRHALRAASEDRYGSIDLPSAINTTGALVVEVEAGDNNRPVKLVLRANYNSTLDVIYVILTHSLPDNSFMVKTVWLNEKNDAHKTLDVTRYCKVS